MAKAPAPRAEGTTPTLSRQLGIRIPADLNTRLEAIAKREQNPVASVCRRLLTAALDAAPDKVA
jgi:predicted DNA-binding protein